MNLVPGDPGRRGCGLTQLAVFCAESLWSAGQVDLLAWVDAGDQASFLAGYAEAAAAVGIGTRGPAVEVAARFTRWLTETSRAWLVVLDGLHEAAALGGLMPAGPAGMTIITSSQPHALPRQPGQQPGARIVRVGAFSTREGLNYLRGRLTGDPDQRTGALGLAQALDGDPGALAQAAAVIGTTHQSCHDYLRLFTRTRAQATSGQANSPHPPPGAVTWVLSAGRAAQLCPGGATGHLLGLAALLDGCPMPGPVFTATATSRHLAQQGVPGAGGCEWEAVQALARTGLLTVDGQAAPALVRVDRATAAHVRASMPEPLFGMTVYTVADALLETWPGTEPHPWTAAALRSCAAALLATTRDRLWAKDECHPLLFAAGRSLEAAHLAGPAAHWWAQITATSDEVLGPRHPGTLTSATHLAQALLDAGRPDRAVTWWRWVATGHTRRSGADHPAALSARVNLGRALAAAGRAGEAMSVLEQAVAACEHTLGTGHPESSRARDGLAAACQAAGRHAQAIACYRRTHDSNDRAHGPAHPATLASLENLARACLAAGHAKDAITYYKQALAVREHVLGADHLDTITARAGLAGAWQAAGKFAAALHLHEQACSGYERTLGAGHPRTLAARVDLAHACHTAGRITDAATLLRETLIRCEQALPAGDPLTATVRQALARMSGD